MVVRLLLLQQLALEGLRLCLCLWMLLSQLVWLPPRCVRAGRDPPGLLTSVKECKSKKEAGV